MERWVEDIRMAIDLAEQSSSPDNDLLSTSLSDNSKSVQKLRTMTKVEEKTCFYCFSETAIRVRSAQLSILLVWCPFPYFFIDLEDFNHQCYSNLLTTLCSFHHQSTAGLSETLWEQECWIIKIPPGELFLGIFPHGTFHKQQRLFARISQLSFIWHGDVSWDLLPLLCCSFSAGNGSSLYL